MSLAAKVRGGLSSSKAKVWFTKRSGDEQLDEQKKPEVIVRSMDSKKHPETDGFWTELLAFCQIHVIECSLFVFFLLFSIFCIFNAFGFVGTNELKIRSEYYKHRVIKHCQFPENRDLQGLEAESPHPNATLTSLLVVVRHGDRYGIRMADSECQKLNEQESREFDEYLRVTQRQNLPSLLKMDGKVESLKKLPQEEKCEPRTLTPRGSIQEFAMGRYLFGKYRSTKLFNTSESDLKVTVTTSQKQRTVASGVALVSGLLDQNQTKVLTPIDFKASSLYYMCTDPGCDCDANFEKMHDMTAKEREGLFRAEGPDHLKSAAEQLMKSEDPLGSVIDPNRVLDFLVAGHACQRKPMPCDENLCISYNLFGDLVEYSISQSVKMFDMDMGIERQYRVMSSFPILRYLTQLMDRNEKEIQLFASHDTVVASILRVLTGSGNFTDLQVYTSRIVFEVYETADKKQMLRVLFNGEDITSSVSFCIGNLEYGLCPASELQKFVAKGIFEMAGFATFDKTCHGNF